MQESQNTNHVQEDDGELFYCNHLVSFLDLMEQRDRLRMIEGILDAPQPSKELLTNALKSTVGTIQFLRNHFKDMFELLNSREPSLEIPVELKEQFVLLRSNSPLHLQFFSDSVVSWTRVQPKAEIDCAQILNSIWTTLITIGSAIPLLLATKNPVRGGMEIEGGITVEADGNEIYGPALNRAYTLESQQAKYPRVVVGDKLLRFLNDVPRMSFQDQKIGAYCAHMAARCQRFILVDEDSHSIVHYLGPAMKELSDGIQGGIPMYTEVILPALKFISECEEKFNTDEKLGPRYQQLRKYFDKYGPDWK